MAVLRGRDFGPEGPPTGRWEPPGPVDSSGASASSRTICLAGLSSRSASKLAWRMLPSGVHSAKLTSATSCGLTQRSLPAARLADQRDFFAGAGWCGEGRFVLLDLQQPAFQLGRGLGIPAGADAADRDQIAGLVVHAEQQAADLGRVALVGAVGEAGDDEFLAQLALELEPGGGAGGDVRRVAALGDQALELHAAGRGQDVGRVAGKIGAVPHDGLPPAFRRSAFRRDRIHRPHPATKPAPPAAVPARTWRRS